MSQSATIEIVAGANGAAPIGSYGRAAWNVLSSGTPAACCVDRPPLPLADTRVATRGSEVRRAPEPALSGTPPLRSGRRGDGTYFPRSLAFVLLSPAHRVQGKAGSRSRTPSSRRSPRSADMSAVACPCGTRSDVRTRLVGNGPPRNVNVFVAARRVVALRSGVPALATGGAVTALGPHRFDEPSRLRRPCG